VAVPQGVEVQVLSHPPLFMHEKLNKLARTALDNLDNSLVNIPLAEGDIGEEKDFSFTVMLDQVAIELPHYPLHLIAKSVADNLGYKTTTRQKEGIKYLRVHLPGAHVDYPVTLES
jgi:hypothetical protein